MSEFGLMGVDWEERIDFDRMRRERLQKAKDVLAKSGCDVLFVFRYEDVRYLTGFRHIYGPVARVSHIVVLPKGGDPILFTKDHEFARQKMPWMAPGTIQTDAGLSSPGGVKRWTDTLRSLIGNRVEGKVGVDFWTLSLENALRKALPETEFVDGYRILMQAKIIKTKDELECQRAAAALTEAGMDAAVKSLNPGVRECEVLAAAWHKFTALGSEWTQCANIVASGPSTAPYRRFTSDRMIREGDLVIIDIGACFNGYWGDITRTYICGDSLPTKEQKALHQECYNALFAACDAGRPGNTNRHIWEAIQNEHSCELSGGHGAGISPFEPPVISGFSPEVEVELKPNMIFNVEPYAGIAGIGGIRLENQVIVTDHEPEIYSTYHFDERLLDHVHPRDKTTGRRRKMEG